MAKLKDKILNALKRDDELETTLEFLSKSQENLLKNYLNPAINDKDRDNILQNYSNLQNIGQSLYRFDTLKSENYLADAQEEKENIENVVLKGGVSYNRYIWHSENGENTCDVCRALDGQVFDYYDEVPARPHPNCRCHVEVVNEKEEEQDKNQLPQEELCDCWMFFDNIDSVIQEAYHLQYLINNDINDISRLKKEYIKDSDNKYIKSLINDLIGMEDPMDALFQTLGIFVTNYIELRNADTHGADKYFHAKANCEAAQRGIVAETIAKVISDLREYSDNYRNIHEKKMSIEESLKDIAEDQKANEFGRTMGRKYPEVPAYELLKILIPRGFPERYKF